MRDFPLNDAETGDKGVHAGTASAGAGGKG